jgi:hypothetical protein
MALLALGRHAEAEERLLASQRTIEAALGAAHPRHADAIERLVRLYQAWSDAGDAQAPSRLAHWQARAER